MASGRGKMQKLSHTRRCVHCGLQYDKFSIANHSKWCRESQSDEKHQDDIRDGASQHDARTSSMISGEVVARVVTLGLTPGKPDFAYIRAPTNNPDRKPCSYSNPNTSQPPKSKARPTTSTIKNSRLQKTGHGVPSQSSKPSGSSGLVRCKKCNRLVASDLLDTHIKICEIDSVRARAVRSIGNHGQGESKALKHQSQSVSSEPDSMVEDLSHLATGRSRKFVICYICGKEYTVHSIAIHVPQCAKKFQAENEQLPISQRRPLPKKPGPRYEDNRVVGGASVDVDAAVQNYFDHCYTKFEDTLVACKICGRTFTGDRHRVHEPNCKAKPRKA